MQEIQVLYPVKPRHVCIPDTPFVSSKIEAPSMGFCMLNAFVKIYIVEAACHSGSVIQLHFHPKCIEVSFDMICKISRGPPVSQMYTYVYPSSTCH